jgi:hypothetical protein
MRALDIESDMAERTHRQALLLESSAVAHLIPLAAVARILAERNQAI